MFASEGSAQNAMHCSACSTVKIPVCGESAVEVNEFPACNWAYGERRPPDQRDGQGTHGL